MATIKESCCGSAGCRSKLVPGSHNMMSSGLRTFALAFLLGGWSAVAAGAEPVPSLASLNSDLARLTLRQAEIFFVERNREVQAGQRLVEGARADPPSAAAPPNPNVFLHATHIRNLYPQRDYSSRIDRRPDITIGINQT